MRPESDAGSNGLAMNTSIPSFMLSFSVRLSDFAVSIITGTEARRGCCFRRRTISRPFMIGIISSTIIRSGIIEAAIARPERPFSAVKQVY